MMYKRSFKAFLQRCRVCCIYLYKAWLFLPLESLYSDLHGKAAKTNISTFTNKSKTENFFTRVIL